MTLTEEESQQKGERNKCEAETVQTHSGAHTLLRRGLCSQCDLDWSLYLLCFIRLPRGCVLTLSQQYLQIPFFSLNSYLRGQLWVEGLLILKKILFIFLERGREGEREGNINV